MFGCYEYEAHQRCWQKRPSLNLAASGSVVVQRFGASTPTLKACSMNYLSFVVRSASNLNSKNCAENRVDYALRFHSKLYEIAEFAQLKGQQELFGGHKHQLLITPGGWRWTMPPSDE